MLAHMPTIVDELPLRECRLCGIRFCVKYASWARKTREEAIPAQSTLASTPRVLRADAATGCKTASICRTVKAVVTFPIFR